MKKLIEKAMNSREARSAESIKDIAAENATENLLGWNLES